MARIIEVTVTPTGETTIQTKGFSGNACQQASKFLEDALGVATSDRNTSEFYQLCEASHNWYYAELRNTQS